MSPVYFQPSPSATRREGQARGRRAHARRGCQGKEGRAGVPNPGGGSARESNVGRPRTT